LLANSNYSVNRWKSYFSQLLNVHNNGDVSQMEIHTAEPLVPGLSHLEVETHIGEWPLLGCYARWLVTSQKMPFFRVTIVKTSSLTNFYCIAEKV
jgi:hypothetical protein